MLTLNRRRTVAAAALALLFVVPLPLTSQTKPAEPLSMQVAKRGDSKKTLAIETNNFLVVFSEQGGSIREFKNKDKAYPLRDGANIVIPRFELFMSPYIGSLENVNLAGANLEASMFAEFKLTKAESPDTISVIATAQVDLVAGTNRIPARLIKTFIFMKNSPYFKFVIELHSDIPANLKDMMFYAMPTIGPRLDTSSSFRDYHHYSIAGEFERAYTGSGGGFMGCGAPTPKKPVYGEVDFFGSSSRFLILNLQPLFKAKGVHLISEQINPDTKQIQQPQTLNVNLGDFSIEKAKPARFEFLGYMGPKIEANLHPDDNARRAMPELAKLNKNLYKSFDFGITEPIRDIIVSALNLLYKLIPNYGVGIILIALLLKLAFFPLNQKQAEAMKRMGELQPKIKEINERYKNNPQEKQRRIMEMYKQHKVNPVSGCLPMLIQLPVFIAMYSAFSDAYDLWQSPFIPGWIPDLSQPDHVFSLPATLPFVGGFGVHLLPVIMTLTQYYQTKLTPTSGDENQRKIMLMMPFMMLFLFYAMPSGVVLYWTVQNVLSIAQQVYTNRKNARAAAA